MDEFEQIKQYKELLDEGIITQEEFEQKKTSLLKLDSIQTNTSEVLESKVIQNYSITDQKADSSSETGVIQSGAGNNNSFWTSIPKLYCFLIIAGLAIVTIVAIIKMSGSSIKNQTASSNNSEQSNLTNEQLSYLQGTWSCTYVRENGIEKSQSDYYLEISGNRCTGYVFKKHIYEDVSFFYKDGEYLYYNILSYPQRLLIYNSGLDIINVFDTPHIDQIETADAAVFR